MNNDGFDFSTCGHDSFFPEHNFSPSAQSACWKIHVEHLLASTLLQYTPSARTAWPDRTFWKFLKFILQKRIKNYLLLLIEFNRKKSLLHVHILKIITAGIAQFWHNKHFVSSVSLLRPTHKSAKKWKKLILYITEISSLVSWRRRETAVSSTQPISEPTNYFNTSGTFSLILLNIGFVSRTLTFADLSFIARSSN